MKYEDLEFKIRTDFSHGFKDITGWENEYFKVIGEAPSIANTGTKWNCLCKACGEYCVKSKTNLTKHKSCGCSKNKNIGKALRENLTGQQFGELTAIEYAGYSNKNGNAVWKCQCSCGNITYVDSNNLKSFHTTSCGHICYSIGAKNIEKILKNNNISFLTEYPIKELYDKDSSHPYRLDFVILDSNNNIIRAIEYDGIQHFQETWGKWKPNITLEIQQKRDKAKNKWCQQNNIPLVRIPFTERDHISLETILGDQFIIK